MSTALFTMHYLQFAVSLKGICSPARKMSAFSQLVSESEM